MKQKKIRTYSELKELNTFEDRFNYLQLNGLVGQETFGSDRYLNQIFYNSPIWKKVRDQVIIRDDGCDLGLKNHEIYDKVIVHHMNPIRPFDILDNEQYTSYLMNPEFLICTSLATHNAIHYGDDTLIFMDIKERYLNDTCPWKH